MTKRSIDEVYDHIELFDINEDNLKIHNCLYSYDSDNIKLNEIVLDLKNKINLLENTIEELNKDKEKYKNKLHQSHKAYYHQKELIDILLTII
tara:strand:- start:621 stop:899 length:279 start_codon:yes stop_codon:yes gene_type:complete